MSKETVLLNQLKEQHLQTIKDTSLVENTKKKYAIIEDAIKRNDTRLPVFENGTYKCAVCNRAVSIYANYCDNCGGGLFWRD